MQQCTTGAQYGRPVALVGDEPVLDDLLRLAAAAGCELERVPDVAALRGCWARAPLVLLDAAGACAAAPTGLARRSGVVVVCAHQPDAPLWQAAVAIGAERVLALPAAEGWLVSAFADAVEAPSNGTGRVLAVLGGRGGAGASVFAAAVALTELRAGGNTLLVDCDPLGGGSDLLLGAEAEDGLRWPQLRLTGGRVAAASLRAALPGRKSGAAALTVLSCDRAGPGPEPAAVAAVVEAGRRTGDTVVCDLSRELPEPACAALERSDLAVLVIPAEVRAAAAARQVAERAREHGATPHAVVRGPAPGDLVAEDVATAAGVPLLAVMRPEPSLAASLERGQLRPKPRGPLTTGASAVLRALYGTQPLRTAS